MVLGDVRRHPPVASAPVADGILETDAELYGRFSLGPTQEPQGVPKIPCPTRRRPQPAETLGGTASVVWAHRSTVETPERGWVRRMTMRKRPPRGSGTRRRRQT